MRHVVLTRFNIRLYTDNPYNVSCADDWMDRRLGLFRDTAASIRRQVCQDFEWWVALDPNTPFHYMRQVSSMLPDNGSLVLSTTLAMTDLEYGEEPLITSRLDSDDCYLPGFVGAIQRRVRLGALGPRWVIDVLARKRLKENGDTLPLNRRNPDSFFISLVEHTPDKLGVCHRAHSGIHSVFPSIRIHEVLAECVIHGGNLVNKFQ